MVRVLTVAGDATRCSGNPLINRDVMQEGTGVGGGGMVGP